MSALAEGALIHYEVEPNYAGWTLAAYVAEKLKRPLPPQRLERLLRGRSLVHAEAELLPETRIWAGLRFALRKRSPGDSGEPPRIPILHEDEALLVVDKPAGLALHPTARYHVSTLTWALAERHRNASGEKPDPAHRLDPETSGIVACGRAPGHTRRLKAAPAPTGMFDDLITLEERGKLRLWRQALHASELTLPHPVSGEILRFESPLPDDIAALLETFRPL